MDDDPGSLGLFRHRRMLWMVFGCVMLFAFPVSLLAVDELTGSSAEAVSSPDFFSILSMPMIGGLVLLIACSAYFSASEVAFFSLHVVRLRSLADSNSLASRGVANLMQHPGRLLITILIGNMIVNVLISVLLPTRLERVFEHVYGIPPVVAYVFTIIFSTMILVFFGEIMPKVIAVRMSEAYARAAVLPMFLFDRALSPIRISVLSFTDYLFKVSRFDDIKAAPFITDEEFFSVLSESEAHGVIEEEEGQMIQRILESGDAMLREILVPRPDVIAIEHSVSVADALEAFREHEFSRMPAYRENLDNVVGILFAKDLLSYVFRGDLDHSISSIVRRVNFVPQTMTIQAFVRDAQHKRMHLAIVADEFGGTEGIVTLEDAIEEIVGDIQDSSDEPEAPKFTTLSEGVFRVDGGLPLDELSEHIGVELEDGSHETVAGFFIEHAQKIAEKGDRLVHEGVLFEVEHVDGKRVSSFRVELAAEESREDSA